MLTNTWKTPLQGLTLIVILAGVAPTAIAEKADAKSIEASITKLELDERKADLAGDTGAWMKAHNADDYTMGTSWGAWEDNAELQKDAADTANNKTTKRDVSDIKVSVYGNHTAIARFKETYDLMIKGQHRARTILTTDVWVSEKGVWKRVASHSSQADQKIGD